MTNLDWSPKRYLIKTGLLFVLRNKVSNGDVIPTAVRPINDYTLIDFNTIMNMSF